MQITKVRTREEVDAENTPDCDVCGRGDLVTLPLIPSPKIQTYNTSMKKNHRSDKSARIRHSIKSGEGGYDLDEAVILFEDSRFSIMGRGPDYVAMCSSCMDIHRYDDSDIVQPEMDESENDDLVYEEQIYCDRCEAHDDDATEFRAGPEMSILNKNDKILETIKAPSLHVKVEDIGIDFGEVVHFDYSDKGTRHYCDDCYDEISGVEEETDIENEVSEELQARRSRGKGLLVICILTILGIGICTFFGITSAIFPPLVIVAVFLLIFSFALMS